MLSPLSSHPTLSLWILIPEGVKAQEDSTFKPIKLHYSFDNSPSNSPPTLLIHILSLNRMNPNSVKSVLKIVWRTEGDITFNHMAFNTFLVRLSTETDKRKILAGCPWSVKGSRVLLKEWEPNIPFDKVTFNEAIFWIQVHSLPPNCMNEDNARAIGNMAGGYLDTNLARNPLKKWKRFLRIKVAVNVHKKLLCGFFTERILRIQCGSF